MKLVATEAFQWIEMFAGTGMATKCVQAKGYRATHIDIKDAGIYGLPEHGSVFDILSPSGFALLGLPIARTDSIIRIDACMMP